MINSCSFLNETDKDGRFYICEIEYQSFFPIGTLKIHGEHQPGKSNNDVNEVRLVNCAIQNVPQGFTNIFRNLEDLSIWTSSQLKTLNKNDLVEYKQLKRIYFLDCYIEFLPGDLFEGFKNLEEIAFSRNKLKIIEPNILDGLNNLKYVNFSENPNYTKIYSSYPEYESNATLEEVKNELFGVFCRNLRFKDVEKIFEAKSVDSVRDEASKAPPLKKVQTSETKKYLFSDITNLIQDDQFKDFKIEIEKREFHVHKFLLIARSPTMAEIILNNPEVENLNLVDISADIFEIILKFIYTDEFPVEDGLDALSLFAAAGRLKMEELKNYAAMIIINQNKGGNVLEVLKFSNKYEHEELRQKAYDEIKKNFPEVRFKDKWISEPEIVMKIIEKFKKKQESIRKLQEEFENELEEN